MPQVCKPHHKWLVCNAALLVQIRIHIHTHCSPNFCEIESKKFAVSSCRRNSTFLLRVQQLRFTSFVNCSRVRSLGPPSHHTRPESISTHIDSGCGTRTAFRVPQRVRSCPCAMMEDARPPRPANQRSSSRPIPIGRVRTSKLEEEEDNDDDVGVMMIRGREHSHTRGRGRHRGRYSSSVGTSAHSSLLSQSCPPRAPIVHSSLPNPGVIQSMPSLALPPPSPEATSFFVRRVALLLLVAHVLNVA